MESTIEVDVRAVHFGDLHVEVVLEDLRELARKHALEDRVLDVLRKLEPLRGSLSVICDEELLDEHVRFVFIALWTQPNQTEGLQLDEVDIADVFVQSLAQLHQQATIVLFRRLYDYLISVLTDDLQSKDLLDQL